MEIKFSRQAKKDLSKIPKNIAKNIKSAILGLADVPPKGDIKPLKGSTDGRMRLRVGSYRVIYRYENDETIYIWIIEIGSRGDIYK